MSKALMFPLNSLFRVHASAPYVTKRPDQGLDQPNFQWVTDSTTPLECVDTFIPGLFARFDFTSSVQEA